MRTVYRFPPVTPAKNLSLEIEDVQICNAENFEQSEFRFTMTNHGSVIWRKTLPLWMIIELQRAFDSMLHLLEQAEAVQKEKK